MSFLSISDNTHCKKPPTNKRIRERSQVEMTTTSKEAMPSVEAELYELSMPGRLLGKEVLDNRARRIGIVRSIRIALNPTRSELIVKGAEVEFPVDFSKVDAVGTVVQLNSVVKDAEEIEVHDVIRLQKEVLDDIKSYLGTR
jgi:sporulation protein YlmC with PRC-barrel domain